MEPTTEQKAHLRAIADKWIAVGQSSGPTDHAACEAAVQLMYQTAKLPPPADENGNVCIVWAQDPKQALRLAAMYVKIDKYLSENGFDWHENKPPVVAHLDLRRQTEEAYKLLGLPEPTAQERNDQRQVACFGQHDVYWCAFYEAMEYLKPGSLERDPETGLCVLDGLIAMTQCGWWWPFDHGVILSERPVEAYFNAQGRFSNRNGPALRYSSGYCQWIVDGVQLLSGKEDGGEYGRLIINRELPAPMVLKEENAEISRIIVELYGEARFIQDLGAKEVHADEFGKLYQVAIPNDEPLTMVRVVDATPKPDGDQEIYWLKVHPELRPLLEDGSLGQPQALTAKNAVASTAGLRGEEYAPEVQT